MSPSTILVIEENPITRTMLRLALEGDGHLVLEKGDGKGALALIGDRRPDLVVVDHVLPDTDGDELLAEIRRKLRMADLPAVIVTGRAGLADTLGASNPRYTQVMTKPIEPSRLVEAVRVHLATSRGRGAGKLGTPTPPRVPGTDARSMALQRERVEAILERMASQNAALLRQAAIQASALTVMRGIAEVLAEPREIIKVIGNVLIQGLDAAGLSAGLLYVIDPEGRPRLEAHFGIPIKSRADAEACFGHPEFVLEVVRSRRPLAFSARVPDQEAVPLEFARRLGHTSVLIVPFIGERDGIGAAVLASDMHDLSESAWVGLAENVSVQFSRTAALGQSLTRLEQLAENLHEVFWLADGELQQVLYVSPAYERIFGRARNGLPGAWDRWLEAVHPEDLQAVRRSFENIRAGTVEQTCRIVRPDGSVRWIRIRAFPVHDASGEVHRVAGVSEDVTEPTLARADREAQAAENARLLEEVMAARERLAVVSGRLMVLQEEERRTIARELHDEVGQILTGIKLILETSGRGNAVLDVTQLKDLVGQLLERVNDLSLNLRPPMLDDLGLVPTLLWHFERYRAQTGIEVLFHHRGVTERLAAGVEIAAFRIIQEALTNVARHAGANDVHIELWTERGRFNLRVEDGGRGFDPAALTGTTRGVAGMRERALLAGGHLVIESRPGGGTRLSVDLPADSLRTDKR